jgi:hypothetical protein
MASLSLESRFMDVVRHTGTSDTPIQAWPLMRRLGQLPPDLQELAIRQISSLLDTFEVLSTRMTTVPADDSHQPRIASMTWEPGLN